MPNGKPGDHPITDIVKHKIPTYSPEIDALVRKLVELGYADKVEQILFAHSGLPNEEENGKIRKALEAIYNP
jgi:hypothetical protein